MKSRSAGSMRYSALEPEALKEFLQLYEYSNSLMKHRMELEQRSVSTTKLDSARRNQTVKRDALTTHYSVKDMTNASSLKHRQYLDAKNQLNLLRNQKQQLTEKLQYLYQVIATYFEPYSVERIMFLYNRLDEEKLRFKEVQSIFQIYNDAVKRLESEHVHYESQIDQATKINADLEKDFEKVRSVYQLAYDERMNSEAELAVRREEVQNMQLKNRLSLDSEKEKIRNVLRREDEKLDFRQTAPQFDVREMSVVRQQQEIIKPLFESMILKDYCFRNLQEFTYRARMTEVELLEDRHLAEQNYARIQEEIAQVYQQIAQLKYEGENQLMSGRSITQQLGKQKDEATKKQMLIRQNYEYMQQRFYQINVFFREYDTNLQLIKVLPEILEKHGIVFSSANEEAPDDFYYRVKAKVVGLKDVLAQEISFVPEENIKQTPADEKNDETIKSIINRARSAVTVHRKFYVYDDDVNDELKIFSDIQRDLYDGELPNNCKVRFESDDASGVRYQTHGVYRSALSDGLRRTRGFRIDNKSIKKESNAFAQEMKTAKLREAGYYD